VRFWAKVAVVDAVLLFALYLVLVDMQARLSYAATRGLSASYAYSLLTNVFQMSSNSEVLRSPLSIDWVQVLVVVLIAANLLLFYRTYRRS
jgi:uncharacterized protein YaaW (UPF0174 family)